MAWDIDFGLFSRKQDSERTLDPSFFSVQEIQRNRPHSFNYGKLEASRRCLLAKYPLFLSHSARIVPLFSLVKSNTSFPLFSSFVQNVIANGASLSWGYYRFIMSM